MPVIGGWRTLAIGRSRPPEDAEQMVKKDLEGVLIHDLGLAARPVFIEHRQRVSCLPAQRRLFERPLIRRKTRQNEQPQRDGRLRRLLRQSESRRKFELIQDRKPNLLQ